MGLSLFQLCGLWIEVKSLWDQQSESPDPMALFCFPKVHLFLVDLFDHKDRKILYRNPIKATTNCKTANVVYMIECKNVKTVCGRNKE